MAGGRHRVTIVDCRVHADRVHPSACCHMDIYTRCRTHLESKRVKLRVQHGHDRIQRGLVLVFIARKLQLGALRSILVQPNTLLQL